MAFGSVHNHSDGSNTRGFMDSTIKVEDLIEYAKELNHIGVVLTDHDTITNHKRILNYFNKVKKENPEKWKDFKLGLGNEIYLCGRKDIEEDKKYKFYHFILIAKDLIGHEQIRTLSTRAWIDNSFTWVYIRTPTFYDDLFEIVEANRGHLIASSACLGGQCPEYILEAYKENPDNPNYKRAKTWLRRIEQCFGKGNFFLELQPSLQEDQKIVNKAYIQLSEELDIPYIWTTDSHYLRKEDRPIHEAFLKSNEDGGKEREVGDFYASTYMMAEEEIHSYTDDYLGYDIVQKGLDNTKLIFDQIEEFSLDQELVIPYLPLEETEPDIKLVSKYKDKIPLLEEYATSNHQCNKHLVKVILEKIESNQEELANQETYEAIGDNLNTIKLISEKTGQQWSGYLLQVRDLVATCWEAGSIVAPGRGSGVGFILLYLLDITQINPLREETKTYPWRFLNPERVSVPDIDSDFINSYRDKVLSLLQQKYCGNDEKLGKRRVMKVQTLSTVKAKSAIQTAARGLGVTPEEAQFLSSFILAPRGMQYNLTQTFYGDENENLPPNIEFVNLMTGKYKEVWNVAKSIEGLINGVGSHAGGVVITSEPIEKYCALMKTSSGDIITQHDLHQIEDEGQQ